MPEVVSADWRTFGECLVGGDYAELGIGNTMPSPELS